MSTAIVARRCPLCINDPREFHVSSKPYTEDLTGQSCERLSVNHFVGSNRHRQAYWCCSCLCGGSAVILAYRFIHKKTRSCGCLVKENVNAGQFQSTHGMTDTRIFKIWSGMLTRCYNEKSLDYPRYGGRGITVCERWRTSFAAFYADVGDPPDGMTMDRKDNMRGYEPDNIKWSTPLEQSNNKRNNVYLDYNGERHTIAEWSRLIGISAITLYARKEQGWSDEAILTSPLRPCRPRGKIVRTGITLTFDGETHTVAEWAQKLGMGEMTLRSRLKHGMPLTEALTRPVAPYRGAHRQKGH